MGQVLDGVGQRYWEKPEKTAMKGKGKTGRAVTMWTPHNLSGQENAEVREGKGLTGE